MVGKQPVSALGNWPESMVVVLPLTVSDLFDQAISNRLT